MVAVYFDNSVIDPIATQQAGAAIRNLMDHHNAEVHGSIQNLVEAWRIDDAARRGHFIQPLMEVAASHEEEPLLLDAARGLANEIGTHHPDWLVAVPNLNLEAKHRDMRRQIWERLRTDPTYRPANMVAREQFLYDSIAASMDRQRVRRRARRLGIALPMPVMSIEIAVHLQPLVDALSDAEADCKGCR